MPNGTDFEIHNYTGTILSQSVLKSVFILMLINKILENCLLSVVTLHPLVAFHLQHIVLILMTGNNSVGVNLKPNPDVQISTTTRKSSKQVIRFSWPYFLAEILIKKPHRQ